jgi:cytosine/adenosine deaminase-related metal-dependent hydrolase
VVERGGRIVAVGRWRDLAASLPEGAAVTDHGDVHLMPGLVNAHAHLELTGHRTIPFAGSFATWLNEVTSASRDLAATDPDGFPRAAAAGAEMLAATGTAAILDTTNRGIRAPFPGVLIPMYEYFAFTEDGADRPYWSATRERAEHDSATALRFGIQPHTPYTVHGGMILRGRELADRHGARFGIHVSETLEEIEFHRIGGGRFAEWIHGAGGDPVEFGAGSGRSPVRRLSELGVLARAVLYHGNYVEDADIPLLIGASASVVYCPRSHRHFGHAPHPAAKLVAAGVNVCLGTDGLVSNEGLDMREEMLCALDRCPDLAPETVLLAATLCGARALGIDGEVGVLAPGLRATLCAMPLDHWPGA